MTRKTLPFWHHAKEISPAMWKELNRLPRASNDTYPCMVEQLDGTTWPCVLFVDESIYRKKFKGCYGMEEPFIEIESVKSILPSPSKTPVHIEKRMLRNGETRMGGIVVTFVLRDGKRFIHVSGGFYEFVSVPPGYRPDDIVKVIIEDYRDRLNLVKGQYLTDPNWKWCVFRRHRILRPNVHEES